MQQTRASACIRCAGCLTAVYCGPAAIVPRSGGAGEVLQSCTCSSRRTTPQASLTAASRRAWRPNARTDQDCHASSATIARNRCSVAARNDAALLKCRAARRRRRATGTCQNLRRPAAPRRKHSRGAARRRRLDAGRRRSPRAPLRRRARGCRPEGLDAAFLEKAARHAAQTRGTMHKRRCPRDRLHARARPRLCERPRRAGVPVVLVSRDQTKLEALAADLQSEFPDASCEYWPHAGPAELLRQGRGRYSKDVALVVNNVGVGVDYPTHDELDESAQDMITVNCAATAKCAASPYRCSRAGRDYRERGLGVRRAADSLFIALLGHKGRRAAVAELGPRVAPQKRARALRRRTTCPQQDCTRLGRRGTRPRLRP